MGNRLFVNYDSKSPARKGISVRFRAPAPKYFQLVFNYKTVRTQKSEESVKQ